MCMEEILYNIEIHKNEGKFFGKIYSDTDGIKEFKNKQIGGLLRDMTIDMQLLLNDFSSYPLEFSEELF